MKRMGIFLLGLGLTLMSSHVTFSEKPHEDKHDHDEEAEHGKNKEHADHDEHGKEEQGKEEHEEISSNVGPGKAILAASRENGIQLSEKAIKTLELAFQTISSPSNIRLPKTAVVYMKDETGIYRERQGLIKLIEGRVSPVSSTEILFQPNSVKDFQRGDRVVVSGVPLLRVAELEAFGGSGEGHGH